MDDAEVGWVETSGPSGNDGPGQAVTPGSQSSPAHKSIREHAKNLQVSVRVIKLWMEKGRAATPPDPPPLADPAGLLAWLDRNHTRAPNVRIVARLKDLMSGGVEILEKKAGEAEVEEKIDFSLEGTPLGEAASGEEALGFRGALERARRAERKAAQALQAALAENPVNAATVRTLQIVYDGTADNLRKYEKEAPKQLAGDADMFSWVEIAAALTGIHGVIVPGLRGLYDRLEARDYAALLPFARRQVFAEELNGLLGQFTDNKFGSHLAGMAAA